LGKFEGEKAEDEAGDATSDAAKADGVLAAELVGPQAVLRGPLKDGPVLSPGLKDSLSLLLPLCLSWADREDCPVLSPGSFPLLLSLAEAPNVSFSLLLPLAEAPSRPLCLSRAESGRDIRGLFLGVACWGPIFFTRPALGPLYQVGVRFAGG
jgi:hypothetical protein